MLRFNMYFFVLVIAATSCEKSDQKTPSYSCNADNLVIDTLVNQKGIFTSLNGYANNAVQTSVNNTVDEVNIYIICGDLSDAPQPAQTVTFSGYVRHSDYQPVFAGATYYELDLTAIK